MKILSKINQTIQNLFDMLLATAALTAGLWVIYALPPELFVELFNKIK